MCKYTKVAKVYKFILTTNTAYGIIIYRKRDNLLSKQKNPTGSGSPPGEMRTKKKSKTKLIGTPSATGQRGKGQKQ